MKKAILLVLMSILVLVGCNRLVTINNINSTPIYRYDGKELNMEQVQRAIALGGQELGWRMQPIEKGLLRATLNVRGKHQAVVDIKYDTKTYSITYRDSENLLYKPPRLIHRNYNRWIAYLVQHINAQFDRITIE